MAPTWKDRYLTTARHTQPDIVPISPETFYYIPVRVSGLTCQQVAPVGLSLSFHRLKTWEAQLECARHFDFCGWIMPAVGTVRQQSQIETLLEIRQDGSIEATLLHHTPKGILQEKFWFPVHDAAWHIEGPVKDPLRDWECFTEMFFDIQDYDFSEASEACQRTGGQGIVSLYIGSPFTDWVFGARQGGYQTAIFELIEDNGYFSELQSRYLAYIQDKTRLLCEAASFDELFIGNEYSELPLLSPGLWRKWDLPVLQVFCETAHRYGALTHWHQHGGTASILPDIADSGLDILCPLEAPPGGDADLARVKQLYGDRLCLKGNLETSLLLNGSPDQVRQGVRQCLQAAKSGGGFILGTGDQVAYHTPFENIQAFVQSGLEFGG